MVERKNEKIIFYTETYECINCTTLKEKIDDRRNSEHELSEFLVRLYPKILFLSPNLGCKTNIGEAAKKIFRSNKRK